MAFRSVLGIREGRGKKPLANKEYYDTLISSKKDAVFLSDIDGDIFLFNKSAQSLTGYTAEDIRDYHIRDILLTLKNQENPLDVQQFSEFTARFFLLDAGGYLIPVMVEFKEIEGQKFLITCVPVEEKKISVVSSDTPASGHNDQMIQPPAMASDKSGRWTIDFEHQARNLLNNIQGFSTILARNAEVSKDKKLLDNIAAIAISGNKLKSLFNKVSIGENDSYEIQRVPCQIAPILQKAQILLDSLARQNSITIQIRQEGDIEVLTDEILLLELLRYFFTQALQFTRNRQVFADIQLDPVRGKVLIDIDNIGQDIPRGIINFIKRSYSGRQYDISNPILSANPEVESMLIILNKIDGKISFSSGEHMGEIVRLEIPAASSGESKDELSQLEHTIKEKSLSILVIEDNKINSTILRVFLDKIASLSNAYSGNEALNIIEDYFNQGKVFSLVIMDIGLPKPWDGILLKAEIEKKWPEYEKVPFLAQTAFTAKSYTDRIAEQNFTHYLLKPVSQIDLFRVIIEAANTR